MTNSEKKILELVANGLLSIDSSGRIWRHKEWINYRDGYRPLLSPRRAELRNGKYFEIHVKENHNGYRAKAHRIVWMHFNGDIPSNLQINHKNGVTLDNCPENLELVTHQQNTIHAYKHGLAKGRPGEKHHNAKLNQEQVKEIREIYAEGKHTMKQVASLFSISASQVERIVNRKRWIGAIMT